jgi:hypothetical protein
MAAIPDHQQLKYRVRRLFLPFRIHKRFDGQRQLEPDRLWHLAHRVATVLKTELARQHGPASIARKFER